MSKKIILNDNEVVTNEDVEGTVGWRARDLHRVLESHLQGTFRSDPGVGMVEGGAIISGLDMSFSASNLDVTISPGSALMAIGGVDSAGDNSFQTGTLEDSLSLSLPVANVTLYRWDLIECSVAQVVTQEFRQVLSVGPPRLLSLVNVDKIKDNVLTFRVRSGIPDSEGAAVLPVIQPDAAWLPLYAIRIDPSRTTLLSGLTSNAQNYDLRKLLRRSRPDEDVGHGFQYQVSLFSSGDQVYSHKNWVQMGNYCSPVSPRFYITSSAGGDGPPPPIRPRLVISGDIALGLPLSPDTWYYIYAYRPHINSGYTSMFLTTYPPEVGIDAPTGKLSGVLVLPLPWRSGESTVQTQYMGAIRLAVSPGPSYAPRAFRQVGGFVSHGTRSLTGVSGAATYSEIYSGTLSMGSNTLDLVVPGDGVLSVPQHCNMARVHLDYSAGIDPSDLTIFSYEDYSYFHVSLIAFQTGQIVLDIPVESSSSTKEFVALTTAGFVTLRAYVVGYYEDTP